MLDDAKHRRSIRLKGYDYSSAGAYFVTVCSQGRLCLLEPDRVKNMVREVWEELARRFPTIRLDEFVVMPNHFHGIIIIDGNDDDVPHRAPPPPVGADLRVCPGMPAGQHAMGEHMGSPLHRVVQWFKTMTTNYYIRGVKNDGWPPFSGRLWQRNYYEHIIRSEEELEHVRQYILDNPTMWEFDWEHPNYQGTTM